MFRVLPFPAENQQVNEDYEHDAAVTASMTQSPSSEMRRGESTHRFFVKYGVGQD